jgi:hypothetical protein
MDGSPVAVVERLAGLNAGPGRVSLDEIEWALSAVQSLRSWVDDQERAAVLRARARGCGWSEIAAVLGRRRQSVWEKHRALDPSDG